LLAIGPHGCKNPGDNRVDPWCRESLGRPRWAAAVELTASDLREIEVAAAKITYQGARYPEHLQKLVGR
jgi:hypothetical protein